MLRSALTDLGPADHFDDMNVSRSDAQRQEFGPTVPALVPGLHYRGR